MHWIASTWYKKLYLRGTYPKRLTPSALGGRGYVVLKTYPFLVDRVGISADLGKLLTIC